MAWLIADRNISENGLPWLIGGGSRVFLLLTGTTDYIGMEMK
jgi:hypothetical protein